MDDADRAQVVGDAWLARQLRRPRHPDAVGDGVCRECGEPIPAARLAALPTAVRCLACQAAWEAGGR